MRSKFLLLFLAIAATIACGGSRQEAQQQLDNQMLEPVAAVREQMLVPSQWLADNLDNGNVMVLHVATSTAVYDTCHIPGALYMPWDRVAETVNGVANELPSLEKLTGLVRELGLDGDKRIVLYDEGNGIRAARAYFTLDYLGLGENAALLNGQLSVWKAGGYPLSAEKPATPAASDYQPTVNEQIVVTMDKLLAEINSGNSSSGLMDCRPPDQFSGENPGRDIERGGHLPGARNVPVSNAILSPDNPLLLETEQLRQLFEQAGFSSEKPVVTYCRTGRSAALSYFVLKYLGYDARLYDGSMIEWQGVENNPVENTAP